MRREERGREGRADLAMFARTMQARVTVHTPQAKRYEICLLSMTRNQPIPVSPSIARRINTVFPASPPSLYPPAPHICVSPLAGSCAVRMSPTALPHWRYSNTPDALNWNLFHYRERVGSVNPVFRNSLLSALIRHICWGVSAPGYQSHAEMTFLYIL